MNRLTFDLVLDSAKQYEAALRSNVSHKESIANVPGMPVERGTFFADTCNAAEISIDRPNVPASPDERDVVGAQQQLAIQRSTIPAFARSLSMGSAL